MNGEGTVLTVEAALFSARRQAGLAAAAASLPGLLRPAAGGQDPDIRVIHAAVPSWPRTLGQALGTSARGVMLSTPTLVPAAEVAALAARAESARCPVVVATPFPHDPTVRDGLSLLREGQETLTIIDSVVTVPDDGALRPGSLLGQAFLAQLAAIRTLIGPVPALTMNHASDRAYSAAGVRAGMTVMLAGLVSFLPAPALRVDLAGVRRRHSICLAEPPSAAPATFLSYGASGMCRPPPSYENGLRGAWRNLHAAVTGGEPVSFGLRELATDLESAAAWPRSLARAP